MVNDVTVNAPPFALKLMRLYGSSGKTRLVMTNSPFPSKASMLQLSTNKRKVYSLAAEIGAEVAVANVLLKSVAPLRLIWYTVLKIWISLRQDIPRGGSFSCPYGTIYLPCLMKNTLYPASVRVSHASEAPYPWRYGIPIIFVRTCA